MSDWLNELNRLIPHDVGGRGLFNNLIRLTILLFITLFEPMGHLPATRPEIPGDDAVRGRLVRHFRLRRGARRLREWDLHCTRARRGVQRSARKFPPANARRLRAAANRSTRVRPCN